VQAGRKREAMKLHAFIVKEELSTSA
jgi:hypothetical protein